MWHTCYYISASMTVRWIVVGSCAVGMSLLALGCDAPDSFEGLSEPELRTRELDTALNGKRVEPRDVAGTFDLSKASLASAAEFDRLIVLKDGTAITCVAPATGQACRPFDVAVDTVSSTVARRPYDVLVANHRRYLVLRTSTADPTPFRVYAIEQRGPAHDVIWDLREITRDGSLRWRMHRLPCSEVMYDEGDAVHACAFYQCKLDMARSEDDRCPYFSEFGLPYCQAYFATSFDDRLFGPNVRQCLQEAIRDTMDGKTCSEVNDAAIQSHVECYVASGYCDLSLGDRLRIGGELSLKDISFDIVGTLAEIEATCFYYRTGSAFFPSR